MFSRITKDSPSVEWDDDDEDDTNEFVSDGEKDWWLPSGFIVNWRGVKKLLPTSKSSFLNWWNDANLKSFHSIHSNMNQMTEMTVSW